MVRKIRFVKYNMIKLNCEIKNEEKMKMMNINEHSFNSYFPSSTDAPNKTWLTELDSRGLNFDLTNNIRSEDSTIELYND